MKYSESFKEGKVSNPIELLAFIVLTVVSAPIRMFSAIAKRILFLGEYGLKLILTCVGISISLLILELTYSLTVSKRLYIYGGTVSILSLVLTSVLYLGMYYLMSRSKFILELDELDDKVEKEDALDKIEEIHGSSTKKDLESFLPQNTLDSDKDDDDIETLLEQLANNELDMSTEELKLSMNSTPKTLLDSVYKHEDEKGGEDMLKNLIGRAFATRDQREAEKAGDMIMNNPLLDELEGVKLFHEVIISDEEERGLVNQVTDKLMKGVDHSDKGGFLNILESDEEFFRR